MATTTNNAKNVSLGKPMVAGAIYRAPAGTKLPTDATTALPEEYKGLGYISEDGITNSTDTDNTTVNEMGGNPVLNVITTYNETYQFVMIETNENSMKARYGDANVSGTLETTLVVTHSMPTNESSIYVIEIAMTGNRVKRIVIPNATHSEFGDVVYQGADAIGYDMTIAANADDRIDGGTARAYISAIRSE